MALIAKALQIRPARQNSKRWLLVLFVLGLVVLGTLLTYQAKMQEESRRLLQTKARLSASLLEYSLLPESSVANRPTTSSSTPEATAIGLIKLNWDGALEAIEKASQEVDGGVVLNALSVTKISMEQLSFSLVGIATDTEALLDYVSALKRDPRVNRAFLVNQRDTVVGKLESIRFQMDLTVDPRVRTDGEKTAPGSEMQPSLGIGDVKHLPVEPRLLGRR